MAKPTNEQIQEELNNILDSKDDYTGSRWPGQTFEEGAEAALAWVLGLVDIPPMED